MYLYVFSGRKVKQYFFIYSKLYLFISLCINKTKRVELFGGISNEGQRYTPKNLRCNYEVLAENTSGDTLLYFTSEVPLQTRHAYELRHKSITAGLQIPPQFLDEV